MRKTLLACLFSTACLVLTPCGAFAQTVEQVPDVPDAATPLPVYIGGRVVASDAGFVRQWPGTYFETAFEGKEAWIDIGEGEVMLAVTVDGGHPVRMVRPQAGPYRIGGLDAGVHSLRIQVISESQAGATVIGGLYADQAMPLTDARPVQIEFIGDSHTVGYGNRSSTRECTETDVWLRTDTSQGPAALIADHYGADYQVNAISGRGVVRNYDGFAGDTLPAAYPHALLNDRTPYEPEAWSPDVVVLSLGTNDFSTPLKPGEKWATRDALQEDFVDTYVAFIEMLHRRYAGTAFVVWATDLSDGEIAAAASAVARAVAADGEVDISFVPVSGLAMTGCHYHPDTADARHIADLVIAEIGTLDTGAE